MPILISVPNDWSLFHITVDNYIFDSPISENETPFKDIDDADVDIGR